MSKRRPDADVPHRAKRERQRAADDPGGGAAYAELGGAAAAPAGPASALPAAADLLGVAPDSKRAERLGAKLRNKVVMLENPLKTASQDRERQLEREAGKRRARAKGMSSRERKSRGLFRLPARPEYESYVPLNAMWRGYIADICSAEIARGMPIGERVSKADLHGASLRVVSSRSPGYVGAEGIVVQETMRAFRIVTRANRTVTLLKPGTVFRVDAPGGYEVDIFGRNFCIRPPDRASKKIKSRSTTGHK